MAKHEKLFAVCAPWMTSIVKAELTDKGFRAVSEGRGGIHFKGHPGRANRVLGTPSRILWPKARFEAMNLKQFDDRLRAANLHELGGVAVKVSCVKSVLIHSDAVKDKVLSVLGEGDLPLHVRIYRDVVTVSVDLSGVHLHRRGWRKRPGRAPIRENIAHGLLRFAGWQPGESLFDPMCGSGTFLIEAAVWALGRAPGGRRDFVSDRWFGPGRTLDSEKVPTQISGRDLNELALTACRENAESARVEVTVAQGRAKAVSSTIGTGLIICNPPYGIRIGRGGAYGELKTMWLNQMPEWRLAVVCPDQKTVDSFGVTPCRQLRLTSGGLSLLFAVFNPPPR